MKMLARMVPLLVMVGFCLPSSGEILVYRYVATGTGIEQNNGEWRVKKEVNKGYIVVQVNYDDYTITHSERIEYYTEDKEFQHNSQDLELVRIEEGSRARWVILLKGLEGEGEEVTGNFFIVAGSARNRNIGTEENREVANTASGYVLSDTTEGGDREFGIFKLSLTLYPAWTYWANGDEGNQDFEATKQMIKDYLVEKGYVEEP